MNGGAEDGFTLLEVLAAFLIAAFGLFALANLLNAGLMTAGSLQSRLAAATHARSVLAELGRSMPLTTGENVATDQEGNVTEISVEPVLTSESGELELLHIEISVTRADGTRFDLATRRLIEVAGQ